MSYNRCLMHASFTARLLSREIETLREDLDKGVSGLAYLQRLKKIKDYSTSISKMMQMVICDDYSENEE